jgi:hypothetical protein
VRAPDAALTAFFYATELQKANISRTNLAFRDGRGAGLRSRARSAHLKIIEMIVDSSAPGLATVVFLGTFTVSFTVGATITGWLFIAHEN